MWSKSLRDLFGFYGICSGIVHLPVLESKKSARICTATPNSKLHTQYSCVNLDDTQAEPPSQEIWYQATPRLS